MAFSFRRKNSLIRIAPQIWLSRLHIVLVCALVGGAASYGLTRILPLTTSSTAWFAIPMFLGIIPVVRWIRFQYLNYQPYYSAGRLYRLFLCNILAGGMIFLLIFLTPILMYGRLWELRRTGRADYDIAQLKTYALQTAKQYAVQYGDDTFKDTRDSLQKIGWNAFALATSADPRDDTLAAYYHITPLSPDKPDHAAFLHFIRNVDSLQTNFSLFSGEDEFIFFFAILLVTLALVMPTFILNLLITRHQVSFFTPFLVSLFYGIVLLTGLPFKTHINDPQAYCYFALLILPPVLLGFFYIRRRNLIAPRRTFCIQALSYCLIMLSILWPLYFSNGQFAASHQLDIPPSLTVFKDTELTRGLLYLALSLFLVCTFGFFYIRWYLAYSLQPHKKI